MRSALTLNGLKEIKCLELFLVYCFNMFACFWSWFIALVSSVFQAKLGSQAADVVFAIRHQMLIHCSSSSERKQCRNVQVQQIKKMILNVIVIICYMSYNCHCCTMLLFYDIFFQTIKSSSLYVICIQVQCKIKQWNELCRGSLSLRPVEYKMKYEKKKSQ